MSDRFIAAAKDGYLDLLREATRKDLNATDEDGMTATHWAASNGNLEALRLIVGRGGDVNKSDYLGYTPLHHAAVKGYIDIVSFLLNWGCNLFALDNEQYSAMDLASLHEKAEVVKLLDTVGAKKKIQNPKLVTKLKEEAIKNSEKNQKRYERLQEEARKNAEKEQRRLETLQQQQQGQDFRAPEKRSFFKTLTIKIRGGGTHKQPKSAARIYSDMTGHPKGATAKKISQKRSSQPLSQNPHSENERSGRRTIRSLDGDHILGASTTTEVMYTTYNTPSDINGSRPALAQVFPTKYKSKSESDLLADSDYISDHDEDERPGIFYRPGFGHTAFQWRPNFLNTLQTLENTHMQNGHVNGINDELDEDEIDMGQSNMNSNTGMAGDMDLPWDQDEVANLDDDETETEFSALETFLVSSGLSTYIPFFTKEKIDLELLMRLQDNELKELGLPFGPMKKLREAMQRRKDVLLQPNPLTDTFL